MQEFCKRHFWHRHNRIRERFDHMKIQRELPKLFDPEGTVTIL
jgi:hypothetical protein